MSDNLKRIKNTAYASNKEMCWVCPGERLAELKSKCRYDWNVLSLVSVIDCYIDLILSPRRRRDKVIRMLRKVMEDERKNGPARIKN